MTTNEPDLSIEFTGDDCFVVFEGARIAKREDGKWISLVSGYAVTGMIPNRDRKGSRRFGLSSPALS
jgi:hypothetical protein